MKLNNIVVILGGSGMLGYTTARYLAKVFPTTQFIATGRSYSFIDLNAANLIYKKFSVSVQSRQELEKLLENASFVINCAGLTWQRAESSGDSDKFDLVNHQFPIALEEIKKKADFKLIHVSTDCVFSGNSIVSYKESHHMDATDIYGKSKIKADIELNDSFILRSSIVGKSQKNNLSLLDWFLSLEKGSVINGFTNHYWNGIGAIQFAKIIQGIIENDTAINGWIQHVVPKNATTKYELLCFFREYFCRNDVEIAPIESELTVRRVLSTQNKIVNESLWFNAGYNYVPTIESMIKELAINYKRWGMV